LYVVRCSSCHATSRKHTTELHQKYMLLRMLFSRSTLSVDDTSNRPGAVVSRYVEHERDLLVGGSIRGIPKINSRFFLHSKQLPAQANEECPTSIVFHLWYLSAQMHSGSLHHKNLIIRLLISTTAFAKRALRLCVPSFAVVVYQPTQRAPVKRY
jgi:hypothetical protein